MKKIKENIIKNKTEYLIIFLILFALIGIFSLNRYALDTYFTESFGMKYNAFNPYFHDGRLFMTAFLLICDFLKLSYAMEKLLSWALALGSLFISAIIIYNLLNKYKQNKILNILLSICLVANPFVIEFFMFPEYTGIMCLSILFISISIAAMVNFWQNNDKRLILLAFLTSMFSVLCYQGPMSLLFIIPLIFVLKDSKNFKDFAKRIILVGLVFLAAAATTAIITKVLGATRVATHINLLVTFKKIINGVFILLSSTYKIFPPYWFLIAFVISLVFCIVGINKKTNIILFLILSIIALFIVPALPHLFTSYVWMVPRSNIGYGIIVALPILFYLIYGQEKKYINYIFISLMSVLLLWQWHSSLSFAKSQIENNILNTQESMEINKFIDNSNNNINKVVVYYDKEPTYVYYFSKSAGDMNARAFGYDWSYRAALITKTGKFFEEGNKNKKYEKYCHDNNWESFNLEQLKIIDDTIHICIY